MKSLKVLMLNGSPHTNGNTAVAAGMPTIVCAWMFDRGGADLI